jgi:putative two-component system response regulator
MDEDMNSLGNSSKYLDRQVLISEKELSELVKSERRAKEMLEETELQLARFAADFGGISRKNKDQNKALEIANFQMKHYISSIEDKNKGLVKANQGTICCLALAADFKDRPTGDHIIRMSRYSAFLALRCGFQINEVENILYASPMHDIGKIGVPDSILSKPGPLNDLERMKVEKHTVWGGEILRGFNSGILELARVIALTHHERWDGRGYPNAISRTDIPEVGRIAALADVLDALTMKRPYKEPMSFETALEVIKRERARMFDPKMVDVLDKNLDVFKFIREEVETQELTFSKMEILNHDKTGFIDWLASIG